jgi:hypothetical protein
LFLLQGKSKSYGASWYHSHFPGGGYLNTHAGDGSGQISTSDYLGRIGK